MADDVVVDDEGEEKDLIPAARLSAALKNQEEKHKAELAEANAKIEAANSKAKEIEARLANVEQGSKKVDQAQRYTRPQLNAAVAAGQITQDAADTLWDNQLQAETRAMSQAVATATVTQAQQMADVNREIDRFKRADPDIMKDGSPVRENVRKAFAKLVSLGDDPRSLATELKAMNMALGDVEQFEVARSGRTEHDTHRETGGGGRGTGGGSGSGKSLYDKLDANSKAHYQKMLEAGQYADEAEIEKELKWAASRGRPAQAPRQRGARA